MAVEGRRILIEEGSDIGARRRSQAFAGKAGEAQSRAGGVLRVAPSASRKAAAASARRPSPFSASPRPNQPGAQCRREIDGLAEQIARRLEIARVKRAPRPLIASVGGEVAGRAGRRHAFKPSDGNRGPERATIRSDNIQPLLANCASIRFGATAQPFLEERSMSVPVKKIAIGAVAALALSSAFATPASAWCNGWGCGGGNPGAAAAAGLRRRPGAGRGGGQRGPAASGLLRRAGLWRLLARAPRRSMTNGAIISAAATSASASKAIASRKNCRSPARAGLFWRQCENRTGSGQVLEHVARAAAARTRDSAPPKAPVASRSARGPRRGLSSASIRPMSLKGSCSGRAQILCAARWATAKLTRVLLNRQRLRVAAFGKADDQGLDPRHDQGNAVGEAARRGGANPSRRKSAAFRWP